MGSCNKIVSSPSLPSARVLFARFGLPVLGTFAVLASGMAYFLWWGPVVHSEPIWLPPGDIWGTIRSSDYAVWGYFGGIYSAGAGLVTFPGILLALAPVVALSNFLRLSVDFPYFMPHPTAWLLIGPYVFLIGCLPLFALDAAARRLGLSMSRRGLLMACEVAAIWQVLVLWGHPEDTIAIGLACYGIMVAYDGRWVASGWLFGVALAFQPLVLLVYPVALLALSRHESIRVSEFAGMIARSVVVPAALLVVPLIASWRSSTRALLDQPNYPGVDHPTPWMVLAPRLRSGLAASALRGNLRAQAASSYHHPGVTGPLARGLGRSRRSLVGSARYALREEVSAGPPRALALIVGAVTALRLRNLNKDPLAIAWLASACLALRCFFEPVMVSFYVWPAFAVALLVAAKRGIVRLLSCFAIGIGASVWGFVNTDAWTYWLVLVFLLAAMLVAAGAGQRSSGRAPRSRQGPVPSTEASPIPA
ncbi:MAG: hypothetical protein M0008_09755 [Actinomycetota bacterium]|nr:hypothetical protein [Actinomycetota bacterium]